MTYQPAKQASQIFSIFYPNNENIVSFVSTGAFQISWEEMRPTLLHIGMLFIFFQNNEVKLDKFS